MKKEPLTPIDVNLLISKMRSEKAKWLLQTLLSLAIWLTIMFLPDIFRGLSKYKEYEILEPVLLVTLLVVGYCYYMYKTTVDKLKWDLNSREKVIENKIICKKQKLFKQNYAIWLNSDVDNFNQFNISEQDYNKIEKGHIVTLEYAEKSKILYKIDLNLSK